MSKVHSDNQNSGGAVQVRLVFVIDQYIPHFGLPNSLFGGDIINYITLMTFFANVKNGLCDVQTRTSKYEPSNKKSCNT